MSRSSTGDSAQPIGENLAPWLRDLRPDAAKCVRCGGSWASELDNGVCPDCADADKRAVAFRARWRAVCGVARRHSKYLTWQDLDGPDEYVKAVGIVRAFVETGDSVLAIIGRRGSGKTQVASTATWQTIEAGRSGRIVTASELASDLKRRFGADSDADGSWLRAWTVPHLLCVDEIAELVAGDVVRAAVTSLLDSRYRMCKPTLLAGNLEPGHFISVVGASVADRCREGGGIVLCNWPSFRGGNGGAERQAVRQAQAPE